MPDQLNEDRLVSALRQAIAPVRQRVERVEMDQHQLAEDTERRLRRFEEVNQRTADTVIHHVERLSRLEAIPDQLRSLESKVEGVTARVSGLETRETAREARLIGQVEQRQRTVGAFKWIIENWAGLGAAAFLLLAGFFGLQLKEASDRQNNIILRALSQFAGDQPTAYHGEDPALRGRVE